MTTKQEVSRHTPGPWRLMNSHKAGFLDIYTTHDTGELEATDFICEIGPGARLAGSVHNANARLIAAAPDLLEACKVALSIAKHWADVDGQSVAKQFQAAITKAEGHEHHNPH